MLNVQHENHHKNYDDTLDNEIEDEDDIVILYQSNQNLQIASIWSKWTMWNLRQQLVKTLGG